MKSWVYPEKEETGEGDMVRFLVHDKRDTVGVATNPLTCETMSEHIDLDVSAILMGETTLDEAGDKLIDMIIRTCNGRLTATGARVVERPGGAD